jgi:tRNA threonylcarbamoyladenosine biosynthesis protein TsaB
MILLFDTSDPEQTSFYLLQKDSLKAHVWLSHKKQAEIFHSEISKFLKKCKVGLQSLKKIAVVVGPGHFSRIRTGVVTANTLAYALKIPVIGIKKLGTGINFSALMKMKGQKSVDVYYDRQPNITKPRKK